MICNMKCSINKKYYFLLLILLFAGGLPAKSSNLDKTKPEDIIRLASYNIRTKGDKGDKGDAGPEGPQGSSVPPGCFMWFCGSTAPNGWLECNGTTLQISQYPELYAAISTTYGGDGVTTFALPDLTRDSGLFIRSTSTERTVGSVQGDAIRNIKGAFGFLGTGKSQGWATNLEGAFGYIQDTTNRNTVSMSSTGTLNNTTKQWTFDASKSVPTAEENRPVNIAFMPVIKY